MCLVWPTPTCGYEIKHLCSVSSHRGKGVEECLINLALRYCKSKGAASVTITFDEAPIKEYQNSVLKPILTEKFGFKPL